MRTHLKPGAERPSSIPREQPITGLLEAWSTGDLQARDDLIPQVYGELRSLAGSYLRRERSGHSLQITGLVHEAYLRLENQSRVRWQDRHHFFGVAAQLMRRILVDHARRRRALRRGGEHLHVSLQEAAQVAAETPMDVLAVDEALRELATIDQRKARLVELRFFGGLEVKEAAAVIGLSPRSAARHWRSARAWLYRRLATTGE